MSEAPTRGAPGPESGATSASPPAPARHPAELQIVLLIAGVQFVNILDFVMVSPLGPELAEQLAIPTSHLGFVGGSYTAAAAVSGLAGAFVLDRFDRRPALTLCMIGLVLGTAAGALATGFGTLLAARVLAGFFGGPATSLALSVISDIIPAERRGRAMGAVMAAFSVASVLGVPAGLVLAQLGGWRLPFVGVAALGAVAALAIWLVLPSMTGHQRSAPTTSPLAAMLDLVRRPTVVLSYAMTVTTTMGAFALIPNLAAYFQYNLHFPRQDLWILYGIGGVTSFAAVRLFGFAVDRVGAFHVGLVGSVVLAAVLYLGYVSDPPAIPILVMFVGFMLAMSTRNVAYQTLTSRVPNPDERAQFMSLQSALQHVASAIGAFASSQVLSERADHSLVGLQAVALFSLVLTATLPLFMWLVERRLRAPSVAAAVRTF
ncbi:MAG: MFS transporter [Deltaproteobacteria bacterium]|nr:MFS transporter [Deltaproteobacteria bacterium]